MMQKLELNYSKQKHPTLPDYARSYTKYDDKTANELTKAILAFMKFNNHHAERINTMGVKRRIKGREIWTKGTITKGSADIHALIAGRACYFEVKVGKDRMSAHQEKYRDAVTTNGGYYFVIDNFETFFNCYNEITNGRKV